jgi:hypothetical protein
LTGFAFILEPITLAYDLNNVRVAAATDPAAKVEDHCPKGKFLGLSLPTS